jgi:hypothetical protein
MSANRSHASSTDFIAEPSNSNDTKNLFHYQKLNSTVQELIAEINAPADSPSGFDDINAAEIQGSSPNVPEPTTLLLNLMALVALLTLARSDRIDRERLQKTIPQK